MPAKLTAFANDVLGLLLNATAIANLVPTATGGSANLTIALHTAQPATDQTSSEISYTGYARVNTARPGGWGAPASGQSFAAANITFGAMTGGTGGTVTHFSIGTGTSNKLMYYGTVAPNIVVTSGVTPQLTTATVVSET
jgi:hypothetical protein